MSHFPICLGTKLSLTLDAPPALPSSPALLDQEFKMASTMIRRALDYTDRPNFDGLGVFFIIFLALYTLVVAAGLIAIFFQRKTSAIRVRGWKLTSLSIALNHVYLAVVVCIYPENGAFKCGGEFWVMGRLTSLVSSLHLFLICAKGVVFPLGLAFFQGRHPLGIHRSRLILILSSRQYALACVFHPTTLPSSWKPWRNY